MEQQTLTLQTIQISYPVAELGERELVLYSSIDEWARPIEPSSVEGDLFLFEVESPEPFFHFKPCLVGAGQADTWCVGTDYISPLPDERMIYPAFRSSPHGTILDRAELEAEDGEIYAYRLYLPPGYEENTTRRYPLCLMHDGHNLFFPEEAFAGQTWEVQRTLELLDKMNSIEACIVVALYPNDRFKDYTEPGCQRFASFITDQLMPLLDHDYRILDGPEHRLVMGSSLGGLLSFYLAWHHSDVFGRAACLSSTFGWDNKLFEEVDAGEKRPIKVYLDSGWPGDNFAETQAMAHKMLAIGYELGRDLHYLAVPEAEHNETAWAQRLHLPFQFLLGLSYGVDAAIDSPPL
jgi:predicted alpha/beta superfamily hydrolase